MNPYMPVDKQNQDDVPPEIDAELYYTPPTDEAFEDLKLAAILLWNTYENEDYRNEKVDAIKNIANVSDNFMYMFAMFDHPNQRKIGQAIKEETKEAIKDRLIAGGMEEWLMPF